MLWLSSEKYLTEGKSEEYIKETRNRGSKDGMNYLPFIKKQILYSQFSQC